ncbi:MAG TPA: cysteine-rich CWC family protein [Pyrinomonadaceae bacterium]|nr:cysteine-rich CWC family protein [Pyrinomonadaceae bacterium]
MKTKTVHDFLAFKEKTPSVCESCDEEFGCGANSESCWCAEINLGEEARQELKVNFKRCLCRNCLENYVSRETRK